GPGRRLGRGADHLSLSPAWRTTGAPCSALWPLVNSTTRVAASGAELDPVAPRVQSAGDGVERERDAAVALVGWHGVQQITGKQHQVARRRRRADPSVGIERCRRSVGVLVLEDKLGTSGRLHEYGLRIRVRGCQV